MSALRHSDNENKLVQLETLSRRFFESTSSQMGNQSFQDISKYEHVVPKTQDRKKAKYHKDVQVMMPDLWSHEVQDQCLSSMMEQAQDQRSLHMLQDKVQRFKTMSKTEEHS
ncbi:hypothetical protein Tco_0987197 [Tanacetum coccineum]